jgi:hypothetical protein
MYSFYRFRTDPLKTTLVTSQLRHPLHRNGLLRMDRPTENPASNSVTVLLRSNVLLVTMKMKSTNRCIATDICQLSLMWEAPTRVIIIFGQEMRRNNKKLNSVT